MMADDSADLDDLDSAVARLVERQAEVGDESTRRYLAQVIGVALDYALFEGDFAKFRT